MCSRRKRLIRLEVKTNSSASTIIYYLNITEQDLELLTTSKLTNRRQRRPDRKRQQSPGRRRRLLTATSRLYVWQTQTDYNSFNTDWTQTDDHHRHRSAQHYILGPSYLAAPPANRNNASTVSINLNGPCRYTTGSPVTIFTNFHTIGPCKGTTLWRLQTRQMGKTAK